MFLALLVCPATRAQTEKRALWDTVRHHIHYLHGTDTVFTLPLDKSFYAQFNHEKKKKRRTVRYRLARYTNPQAEPIPVVVNGSNSLLNLRGTLYGDTTASFSLALSLLNNEPVLEVLVPGVSINELSFEVHYRQTAPAPLSLVQSAPLKTRKKKKYLRIQVYGNMYRVALKGI